MRGRLALIGETRSQRARDVVFGMRRVIAVIAFVFGRQQHMPGMVIVVVPLRAILPGQRLLRRVEQARLIVVILQHEMDQTPGVGCELADRMAQLMQHRDFAVAGDGVDGVEPQPIETIIAQPRDGVLDRVCARLRLHVIDRDAPRRLVFGEELRRIEAEVISVRPEMIIDDVEKHHQAALMRGVDQRLEIVRAAIGTVGRIPQHAVIAPIARARKIRQRHQFERCESRRDEIVQPVDHRRIGAFLGEGADMGFDQHRLLPRPAAPIRCAPCVSPVVDDLARAGDVVGLEARSGIGHLGLAIDLESIARTGFDARHFRAVPAVLAARQRMRLAVDQHIDALGRRCPEPERGAVSRQRRTESRGAQIRGAQSRGA